MKKSMLIIFLSAFALSGSALTAAALTRTEFLDMPGGSMCDYRAGVCQTPTPDKEQLQDDAKRLAENFKAIFKDLSDMSRAVIMPAVEQIADWIEKNYAHLSERSRERVQDFMLKMEKEYKDLKGLSVESSLKILNDLREFLEQFKKKSPQPAGETWQEPVSI